MLRLTLILSLAAAACGGNQSSTPETTPTTTEAVPPGPETRAAMTPEECTKQGGEVRGDIGDGKIACDAQERELGRVMTGIEGGVCCASAVAPAP
ncbi:MAG: hypothetical protein H0X17_08015 [Deltaproteobacteria bacterium]|nr:hypothetical protein [Deltaproteobacteria bacterium]